MTDESDPVVEHSVYNPDPDPALFLQDAFRLRAMCAISPKGKRNSTVISPEKLTRHHITPSFISYFMIQVNFHFVMKPTEFSQCLPIVAKIANTLTVVFDDCVANVNK